MSEQHTEVPATPDDYAHLRALETAARDGGVCVQNFSPYSESRQKQILDELAREAERQGEYARLARIPYCEQCGHRVPADYPCEHLGES